MIFFFGDGRLGNQLFQYAFIRTIAAPEQYVVTYSFTELLQMFEPDPRIINIRKRWLKVFWRRMGMRLLEWLAWLRLLSSCRVEMYSELGYEVPNIQYSCRSGVLPWLYIYPCYAQSEIFFDKHIALKLQIRKQHVDLARNLLAALPQMCTPVFVHVRRTDYLVTSAFGIMGVELPLSYYLGAINWIEEHVTSPYYVFLTDDEDYVAQNFTHITNKIVSRNDPFADFALMTLCEFGIMSNSSFSWWGAYLMKHRKKVFAPQYWLGWKSRIEYHKGVRPSFAENIEVAK